MDSINIIYERFISPISGKQTKNIGTELEFPLINTERKPVDEKVAKGLLKSLISEDFKVEDTDLDGNPAFIVNGDGDVISYDNSYNNIEFSMNYGKNLVDISNRFYALYRRAQQYFTKYGYIIAGMGSNLFKKYITPSHVNYPVYNMVDEYLHEYNCDKTHNYPDFPAYLSSVQTHLDVNASDAAEFADFFAKMDFAAAFLFANSLSFDDTGYLCFRDYLWENSAFGLLGGNTGCPDKPYRSAEGIVESLTNRGMFNRIRNGAYEVFEPVSVKRYFERTDALPSDINQFLSFKNIEITARGTLEIRSTCAQPIAEAFCAPAFYTGLANNFECAVGTLDGFFCQYDITESNSVLRRKAVKGILPSGVDEDGMKRLLVSLVQLAMTGLKRRNYGEEFMVKPLLLRAGKLESPALKAKRRLDGGEDLLSIIRDYSKI